MLTQRDVPGFKQITSSTFLQSPMRGVENTTFLQGATVGFITEKAFRQPYLAEERAQEKALKYPPMSMPLVPLHGQIVANTPGLLEVYETVAAYSSSSGASSLEHYIDESVQASGGVRRIKLLLPFDYEAIEQRMSPVPSATTEHQIRVEITTGRTEFDFAFRGGDAISISAVSGLVAVALNQQARLCGGGR
jgi:hypothetical protein